MNNNKIIEADNDINKLLNAYGEDDIHRQFVKQLRVLIDYLCFKYYERSLGREIDYNYHNSQIAITKIKNLSDKNAKFIGFFHDRVNVFAHDVPDNESAKAIIINYFEELKQIKKNIKKDFDLDILKNLYSFYPKDKHVLDSYYKAVGKKVVDSISTTAIGYSRRSKYYVIKERPFFVDGFPICEVTLSPAVSKNKFDRFIAFSSVWIPDNYAVDVELIECEIKVSSQNIPILVVLNYKPGIRVCEFNNLARLLGKYTGSVEETTEYNSFLNHLSMTGLDLLSIVYLPDDDFKKLYFLGGSRANSSHRIYETLQYAKSFIYGDKPGKNLISLLLKYVRNTWIRDQIHYEGTLNAEISNLPIRKKSIPFEKMPFAFSIYNHDIPLRCIYNSIDSENRQCEIMARYLENNVNDNGVLFTPIDKLTKRFSNPQELAKEFNSKLYSSHKDTYSIVFDNDYAFLNGYENATFEIIKKLKIGEHHHLRNYESFVESAIKEKGITYDSPEKEDLIKKMFSKSLIYLLTGPAGTGKTFFISMVFDLLSKWFKPLVLARTNSAVKNLMSRASIGHDKAMTINKYLWKCERNEMLPTSLLIIDECSTVSNSDMIKVLNTIDNSKTALLLVGDDHQIESIDFGNWFALALKMLSKNVGVLQEPHRIREIDPNSKMTILKLWNCVRNPKDKHEVLEIISNNYYYPLERFDFSCSGDDEIVLCLNYDGMYGINNINRIMQSKNKNPKSVIIGDWRYSVNDPIIFDESSRFSRIIFNDTKGKILDVTENEYSYVFKLLINQIFNPIWNIRKPMEFISVDPDPNNSDNSIITIKIDKGLDPNKEEDEQTKCLLPFRIAYAASIHKAQGLEYKKVRIVISDGVEKLISPNIFYTAITRTTEKLEIYCSQKSISDITDRLYEKNIDDHDYREFLRRHHELLK